MLAVSQRRCHDLALMRKLLVRFGFSNVFVGDLDYQTRRFLGGLIRFWICATRVTKKSGAVSDSDGGSPVCRRNHDGVLMHHMLIVPYLMRSAVSLIWFVDTTPLFGGRPYREIQLTPS